jgi:hypothetical protein
MRLTGILPCAGVGAALLGAGCAGWITGGDDDDDRDGEVTIAFTSPPPGSLHPRDVLADDGWLVAGVPVAVAAPGASAVEIAVGETVLGEVDDAGELTALVRELGAITLTARARRGDAIVAEATLAIEVIEPVLDDCRAWLDLYGLTWEPGPTSPGVDDPIRLSVPVNGVSYRYVSNQAPRTVFTVIHCELARSLARAAPHLRARGVVEVADIGVYNYRCIGGGTPPDCPNGISQHAYAKAIDIAGFTDGDGTFYSVNDDWVIDPAGEPTCSAATEPGADTFLHETICELKAAGVWNIVLTPNYNAAHRNHFHVDLTPGSDFIRRTTGAAGPATSSASCTH